MNVYLLNINFATHQHIEYYTSLSNLLFSIEKISRDVLNSECDILISDTKEETKWGTLIHSGYIKDVLTNLDYEFKVFKLKLS